ncbi:hypothetical protein N0V95_001272 [Ascochyta clinopodiicola]|nr:hypothetical protein N0V95_001272 [Ascochyta clinopodiicola]
MHILGLANGSIDGNSTILLKAALQAAKTSTPNTTTSWIHVPSLSYPPNAGPLAHAPDVSMGTNKGNNNHGPVASSTSTSNNTKEIPDDRPALYEAIMTADALILSSAVYSHQPAGSLKSALDKILGPYTDPVFATRILDGQARGDPKYTTMHADARVLRPRVAGFLAVGGSTTPDQFAMALPTLHLFAGKEKHIDDIFKNGSAEWKGLQGSKEKLQEWEELDVGRVQLPSEQHAKL